MLSNCEQPNAPPRKEDVPQLPTELNEASGVQSGWPRQKASAAILHGLRSWLCVLLECRMGLHHQQASLDPDNSRCGHYTLNQSFRVHQERRCAVMFPARTCMGTQTHAESLHAVKGTPIV